MFRYLLILLAVLVTGLAILFGDLWLYVVAGLADASVLGFLGWTLWNRQEESGRDARPRDGAEDREDTLQDLGIVDIRPQDVEDESSVSAEEGDGATAVGEGSSEGAAGVSEPSPPGAGSSRTEASSSSSARSSRQADDSSSDQGPTSSGTASAATPTGGTDADPGHVGWHEGPVLGPVLESLRAALGAQTVSVLVQEDIVLSYRIESIASTHQGTRTSGTFTTQMPLLTAGMAHEAVTIRTMMEDDLTVEDLGYYERPPTVDHLAVAPISRPDDSATYILLADAPPSTDLRTARARTILSHFAETVAVLLDAGLSPSEDVENVREEASREERVEGADISPESPPESISDAPRPRRDIIAEEMDAADEASEALSLLLVHLNRAESIARRGEEAVASAERLLQARLQQAAPNQRIERFGELTYGLFYRGGVDTVEPWVTDLEERMAEETGTLEGGISVGVAVYGPRHEDAESLRAEATEALREAYETGTSTIVS